MTAIELANLGLQKIGVSQGISALDEATREAYTAGVQYDHLLRETLRAFNWPFATAYARADQGELLLTEGAVWDDEWADYVQTWSAADTYRIGAVVQYSSALYYCVLGHTNQTPPNATYWAAAADSDTVPPARVAGGDWRYCYRWPTDCLRLRRLVDEATGRAFNRTPIPFRSYRDPNGQLIATNEPDAKLEYTLLDCDDLWADDIFLDAFTWRLAAAFAPSLSRNKLTAADCFNAFAATLRTAAAVHLDEQQQEKPGDAEWLEAR
jgi:hypothetical protein